MDTRLTQHSHCRTYLRAGSKFSKCSIGHQMDFLPRNCPFRAVVMEGVPGKEKAGAKKAFCRDQTSLTGRTLRSISAGRNGIIPHGPVGRVTTSACTSQYLSSFNMVFNYFGFVKGKRFGNKLFAAVAAQS